MREETAPIREETEPVRQGVATASMPGPAAPLASPRGQTIVSPKAVSRIAGAAASEVEGVEGVQGSGLTRFLSPPASEPSPRAEASVGRQGAAIDLSIGVRYPEPVRQVAERVRQRVAARVSQLTGLQVMQVNIDVARLVSPGEARGPTRRVV